MLCSDNLKHCQLASTDLSGNSNNALLLGRVAITQGLKILAFPRIEDGFDPDKDFLAQSDNSTQVIIHPQKSEHSKIDHN